MPNQKHVLPALLIAMSLSLFVGPALAKGAMPVRIQGPGLPAAGIEVTDRDNYEPLAMGSLPDFYSRAAPLSAARIGYAIQRFWVDEAGNESIFDDLVYYPAPNGGRGIVHYVGIHNGRSEYDGEWYYASRAADAVLRRLLGLSPQCGPSFCLE